MTSRTVNLAGLTPTELHALAASVWLLDVTGALPDAVLPALTRLQGAARAGARVVSKVDRQSLQALVDAVRLKVESDGSPAERSAFAKVEARLARARGRPAVAGLWQQRAAAVLLVSRALEQQQGRPATDREIARALGAHPDSLRKWRARQPGLFPPAAT